MEEEPERCYVASVQRLKSTAAEDIRLMAPLLRGEKMVSVYQFIALGRKG